MDSDRLAMMVELEPVVEQLLPQVRPVEDCWQPADLLPDLQSEGWRDDVQALRDDAAGLSDAMLVVLVGNIVTEEALPSYQTALNRFGGLTDATGKDEHAWARWSRAWTAEEKRHGDVTRAYLYLSGRVDMKAVEKTIQYLLRGGFDSGAGGDPYRGLAYVSFQEHATKTAWSQLGKIVGNAGAPHLHKVCGMVAADEARHERVYATLMREIVARDPVGALEALADTLAHAVVMPAREMTDGRDRRLFAHFADVGQRIGVYTLADYAANLAQLIASLGLEDLTDLPGEAGRARDALCALPARYAKVGETRARNHPRPVPFQWIHGRRA
jgi:acyl-[acyl-carrier-protein] desaturase